VLRLAPLIAAAALGLAATPAVAARCVPTADGCVARDTAARHIATITRQTMSELGMRAAIVRVDTAGQPLLSRGFGTSMAGTPATPAMHFRIGSMAIPHLITAILQLQDQGRLKLDDPVGKFLPGLPNADQVTLRMLADDTSGYADWIQGNPVFVDALLGDPFRQWSPQELLDIAFALPAPCAPGACFSYAHTNYAVLAQVVEKITGEPAAKVIRDRVLRPLGLRQTEISRYPAMPDPVLHSYSADRGHYEDATFWSPSWTIGAGTVMNATIGDVARTARAIGTGALLTPASAKERVAAPQPMRDPFTADVYYALGILVSHTWQVQNPMLNGYTGSMGYLPSQDLTIAIVATQAQGASGETAYASRLFERLTAYLSPQHTAVLPG
jgi:D-alanyl-D-alanine carboxypeptidase